MPVVNWLRQERFHRGQRWMGSQAIPVPLLAARNPWELHVSQVEIHQEFMAFSWLLRNWPLALPDRRPWLDWGKSAGVMRLGTMGGFGIR
jgi:hypothetical protein